MARKRSQAQPSDDQPDPGSPPKADVTMEVLRARAIEFCGLLMRRFEERLKNPSYVPTPADILASVKLVSEVDQLSIRIPSLLAKLQEIRNEAQSIETSILNRLALSPDVSSP